jgi:hypothetical protein
MKRILLTMSALVIAGATSLASANAQGVGVQVGPVGVGVGVGPYADGYYGYGNGYYGDDYRHNWRHDYGYARDCRVIRERVETPSGRTIIKTRRAC